jgi:hypothetical protein
MNPDVQKALLSWLQGIQQLAAQGKDFILTQAPQVVQEKVAWGRAWETIELVIFLAILSFGIWGCRKTFHWAVAKNKGYKDGMQWLVFAFPVCFPTVIIFWMTMYQLYVTLQVWFAPRLYIIDWIISMVKDTHGS